KEKEEKRSSISEEDLGGHYHGSVKQILESKKDPKKNQFSEEDLSGHYKGKIKVISDEAENKGRVRLEKEKRPSLGRVISEEGNAENFSIQSSETQELTVPELTESGV